MTWRLIHIWEAVSITLSLAGASRARELGKEDQELKKVFQVCREHYYGRNWDPITEAFNSSQGALDGSATRRIDILWEFSRADDTASVFLACLKKFLLSESIELRRIVAPWSRICDVPREAEDSRMYSVREAMRHVNTFRNRFAHVPFPYDAMDDLAKGLEKVTEQLFTTEPYPWIMSKEPDKHESPLCGTIIWRNHVIEANVTSVSDTSPETCSFCYPPIQKKGKEQEVWNAEPFVYVDSMLRSYVLTRLRVSSAEPWEFTRFRAESNSVVFVSNDDWISLLPKPSQDEYITQQDIGERKEAEEFYASRLKNPPSRPSKSNEGADLSPEPVTFDDALRYIRNEDYKPAIDYISDYVRERPDYHIGWLKLGNAQREYALRVLRGGEAAIEYIDESINSLTKAYAHRDSSRKAQALYERSKSYFHKGNLCGDADQFKRAVVDAKKAISESPEYAYESWLAYLEKQYTD